MTADRAPARPPEVRSRGAVATRRRRPLTRGRVVRALFLYAGMIIALVVVVAPFSWLVISSVADKADLLTKPLEWIPAHISLGRFVDLTVGSSADETAQGFRSAIMNSMVIASATTAVGMVVGTLAAYAFARLWFPGRGWMIRSRARLDDPGIHGDDDAAADRAHPAALPDHEGARPHGHADRPDHHLDRKSTRLNSS